MEVISDCMTRIAELLKLDKFPENMWPIKNKETENFLNENEINSSWKFYTLLQKIETLRKKI